MFQDKRAEKSRICNITTNTSCERIINGAEANLNLFPFRRALYLEKGVKRSETTLKLHSTATNVLNSSTIIFIIPVTLGIEFKVFREQKVNIDSHAVSII